MFFKGEIVTRQSYDQTGQIKYHQIPLLKELLQALHGPAHINPGISKMQKEISQNYYHPGIAEHARTAQRARMGSWTRGRNAE